MRYVYVAFCKLNIPILIKDIAFLYASRIFYFYI